VTVTKLHHVNPEKDATRCFNCGSKLGLGVRFLNLWNCEEWVHVRFCSTLCQTTCELERRTQTARNRWIDSLARDTAARQSR
jgi:hypothetical protein